MNTNITNKKYDIIIVGGGSSGLMLAHLLNNKNLSILLLESTKRIATKLLMTGNGRCNVISSYKEKELEEKIYNGRFLRGAFLKYDLKKFFENNNLALKEENMRLYPKSEKSIDVVNMFNIENIVLKKNSKVTDLIFDKLKLIGVVCGENKYYGEKIVLCTGGKSFPKSGSDGSMHNILKKHNISITKTYPSEVPLVFPDFSSLSGVSIQNVKIFNKNHYSIGDILFTHKGISGPCAIGIGEFVARENNTEFFIDFLPDITEEKLFLNLFNNHKYLQKSFPKSFYKFIMEDFPKNNPSKKNIRKFISEKIKRYSLKNVKTLPIEKAFVTAGGINLKEINNTTLSHKKIKNLYFAGELLDLHGEIGGFNLTIAWISAMIIADNII